jgi:hypothetical protein
MGQITTESGTSRTDLIKRTTGPVTMDGRRWEVQLNAAPTREWLQFFKMVPSEPPGAASPQRLVFDRASAVFKSDADHVVAWVESIDRWLAWTGARYLVSLDEASRARSTRLETEARERDRIQQLNDRFKDL